MDIRSLARSMYDPGRMNFAYRDEKRRQRETATAADAAQYALPGSIAEREDPNRFGSVAGRFSALYRPEPAHLMHSQDYYIAEQQAALQDKLNARSKLRRKPGFDFEGAEDLLGTDDLFGGLF